MISDKEKKEQFDKLWENKYKAAKYKFAEYLDEFSNRQVPLGCNILVKNEETQEFWTLEVVNKPCYQDRFYKTRYRGWFRCKNIFGEDPDEIILCHTRHIMKLIK